MLLNMMAYQSHLGNVARLEFLQGVCGPRINGCHQFVLTVHLTLRAHLQQGWSEFWVQNEEIAHQRLLNLLHFPKEGNYMCGSLLL